VQGKGWTPVTDLLDTGAWDTVYNFRIADYHTYFVGDDHWGFSVWAHNAYDANTWNKLDVQPHTRKSQAALDRMAAGRQRMGMALLGTAEGDGQVLAKVIVDRRVAWGRNKLAREAEPVYVLKRPNIASLEHAEGEALNGLALRRISTQGRRATLITDVEPCDWCGRNGGINSLAWQLGLKELDIISPSGRRFLKVYEPGTL
jgi:hypothetical protein